MAFDFHCSSVMVFVESFEVAASAEVVDYIVDSFLSKIINAE